MIPSSQNTNDTYTFKVWEQASESVTMINSCVLVEQSGNIHFDV